MPTLAPVERPPDEGAAELVGASERVEAEVMGESDEVMVDVPTTMTGKPDVARSVICAPSASACADEGVATHPSSE